MELNDALYKAFLEQMQALENFRMAYASTHPSVPLDRDDPDVKRLLEAVAFFSARTHRAGLRNIVVSHLRLFQQYFPYLLNPLPAMGILKAVPTGQFTETVTLPGDSEFILSAPDGQRAVFQTIQDLRILPLYLTEAQRLMLPGQGYRLLLTFTTPHNRNEEIGSISLFIDHMNNYKSALQIFYALKQYVRRVSVVFNERVTETTRGSPGNISFGLLSPGEDEWRNPIMAERIFFHFPRQDLFVNFQIPPPPSDWNRFTICLDLHADWPRNLILNRDVFQMFAVPIINLKSSPARPLICDGTQEQYPILFPDPEKGFELHSIKGVYMTSPDGLVHLKPGIMSGGNGSYEVHQRFDPKRKQRESMLHLNFPQAFEAPRTITVEGRWFQPDFSRTIGQKLRVIPYSRHIPGLAWETLGSILPHRDNRFGENMDNFMHLFTLKNKTELDRDDLHSLLMAMGSPLEGEFRNLLPLLSEIRIEKVPPKQKDMAGMIRLLYHFRFRDIDPSLLPLLDTFTAHIGQVLDAWISNANVDIRLETSDAAAISTAER